jgi:purine-binding chemotaxis protein CheW
MTSHKFVTFKLNEKLFGIDIMSVREINRQLDARSIPQAPPYVHGLINLRGQIVTMLDLSYRLGMGHTKNQENAHNIILKSEIEGGGEGDRVGILVDEIGDIVTTRLGDEDALPANLEEPDNHFLERVVKLDSTVIGILSVKKILAHEASASNV